MKKPVNDRKFANCKLQGFHLSIFVGTLFSYLTLLCQSKVSQGPLQLKRHTNVAPFTPQNLEVLCYPLHLLF